MSADVLLILGAYNERSFEVIEVKLASLLALSG